MAADSIKSVSFANAKELGNNQVVFDRPFTILALTGSPTG
jgi:hypothetical protein